MTVIGKHPDKLVTFSPYADTVLLDDVMHKLSQEGFTAEDSFEVVVDAAGHPTGMELALQIVRRQGTIVLKSTYAGKHPFDLSLVAVNELKIEGSRCGPFEPALALLKEERIVLPEPEWHSLEDYEAAFSSKAFKAGFVL